MTTYLLMRRAELLARPTTGPAWAALLGRASATWEAPNLQDHNVKHGTGVLAAALAFARTGDKALKAKAKAGLFAAIATLPAGTTSFANSGLGPLRQVTAYVLAADLLQLAPTNRVRFADWLRWYLNAPYVGTHPRWGGVARCSEDSNNNWWGWAIAARVSGARFLGDEALLLRCWALYRGFMGDRAGWSDFRGQGVKNGALVAAETTWACDASAGRFVPVNGPCVRSGIDLDGVVPGDIMRDDVALSWPPGRTGMEYTLELLCGAAVAAELLHQAGHHAYGVQDSALRRAAHVVTRSGGAGGPTWNLSSVSYHLPWLLNRRYGLQLPTKPAGYGRTFGFTDWLYGA